MGFFSMEGAGTILVAGLLITLVAAGTFPSLQVHRWVGHSGGGFPSIQITSDLLHINGTHLQDSSFHSVRLAGLDYGDYPNDVFPNRFNTGSVTQDALDIRSAGFNLSYLVIEWGALENSTAPASFSYNSSYQNRIANEVNALTSQGIYVILKLHADCDTTADCDHLNTFLGPNQYCGSVSPNGFRTPLGLYFYTTSSTADASDGIAHLTKVWQLLSSLTGNNGRVIGYDPLNEPWYCQAGYSTTIRSAWHARMNEMVSTLRNGGDNRIIFLEEAPNYEYYGSPSTGVSFNASDIAFTNWASDVHYYKGEYPSSLGGNFVYAPCFGDYATLYGYWSNTATPGNGCTDTDALWVHQAELLFPNQAFSVGEFGDIWGNSPGGLGQSWNVNVTRVFLNDPQVVGWSYWAQGSNGTWTKDILPLSLGGSVGGTVLPAGKFDWMSVYVGAVVFMAAGIALILVARKTTGLQTRFRSHGQGKCASSQKNDLGSSLPGDARWRAWRFALCHSDDYAQSRAVVIVSVVVPRTIVVVVVATVIQIVVRGG